MASPHLHVAELLWTSAEAEDVAAKPSMACIRARFSPLPGEYGMPYTLLPSSCTARGMTVCRAAAGQAATREVMGFGPRGSGASPAPPSAPSLTAVVGEPPAPTLLRSQRRFTPGRTTDGVQRTAAGLRPGFAGTEAVRLHAAVKTGESVAVMSAVLLIHLRAARGQQTRGQHGAKHVSQTQSLAGRAFGSWQRRRNGDA